MPVNDFDFFIQNYGATGALVVSALFTFFLIMRNASLSNRDTVRADTTGQMAITNMAIESQAALKVSHQQVVAKSDAIKDLSVRIARLEPIADQVPELKTEITSLKSQVDTLNKINADLSQRNVLLESERSTLEAERDALKAQVRQLTDRVAKLEKQIEDMKKAGNTDE
ncbi:MAG: hypothetical protein ACPG7F_00305 [Aggregatilineales bacterium]